VQRIAEMAGSVFVPRGVDVPSLGKPEASSVSIHHMLHMRSGLSIYSSVCTCVCKIDFEIISFFNLIESADDSRSFEFTSSKLKVNECFHFLCVNVFSYDRFGTVKSFFLLWTNAWRN
jgi:hypothetical protein